MSLICLIGLALFVVLLLVVLIAYVTSPEYQLRRISKRTKAEIRANSKEFRRYIEQATHPYRRRR